MYFSDINLVRAPACGEAYVTFAVMTRSAELFALVQNVCLVFPSTAKDANVTSVRTVGTQRNKRSKPNVNVGHGFEFIDCQNSIYLNDIGRVLASTCGEAQDLKTCATFDAMKRYAMFR